MTTLHAEVTGARETVAHLGAYSRHLDDFRDLWPDITQAFVAREKLWFGTQGGSGGAGGWPALSPDYAAWKAVVYPGKPILVATGELKDSLTDPAKAKLAETDTMLVLGTSVPHAKYHATGTSKMPARPPLIPVIRLKAAIARLVGIWVGYDRTVGGALFTRQGNMRAGDWAGSYVPWE